MASGIEAELEREVDRLYGLSLEDFIPARETLAKRAREEGQRAIAGRIKALRKPTVSAWVVNQLARENELDVQRLLKAGAQLAEAQLAAVAGKDAGPFLQTRADEQRALTQLAAAAREIIKQEGIGTGALERVTQTLRAAATTEEGRQLLKQGRLTEDREPQGFEALARVVPKPRRAAGRKEMPPADAPRALAEARRRSREAAKRSRELARKADAAEREAERAEANARKAREAAGQARADATTAADAAADAEAELARLHR